ncbi:hypothetical protein ACWY4P_53570 (plasmid) [Streptomyces sp. LZ34]
MTAAERAASSRWQVRRRRLMAAGLWEPFVDAEPVREHLRKVNAAGMPYMAICERLGLAQNSSLQHLMWGRGEYGPGHQVRRETAELVLSYWPSLDDFPDGARIDATGTRRRVEALAVRGWSRQVIAERVGMTAAHFKKAIGRERVTARLARAVASVYDAWWNQNPLDHGVPQQSVSRARSVAQRAGFHSALAWDDDTIDDPSAVPVLDAEMPAPDADPETSAARWLAGEAVVLGDAARRLAIRHLMEWTPDSVEVIAARLEMSPEALSRSWERIKKRERDAGRKAPWRRAYLTARELGLENEMTNNDMERAA